MSFVFSESYLANRISRYVVHTRIFDLGNILLLFTIVLECFVVLLSTRSHSEKLNVST